EVPFKLEIKNEGGKLSASVWNGTERMPFTSARLGDGTLTLRFEQYDGTLNAKLENGKLVGGYYRPYAKGVVHYPFKAERAKAKPIEGVTGVTISDTSFHLNADFEGEFIYRLTDQSGKSAENGVLQFQPPHIEDGNGV